MTVWVQEFESWYGLKKDKNVKKMSYFKTFLPAMNNRWPDFFNLIDKKFIHINTNSTTKL